jgi:transketolase
MLSEDKGLSVKIINIRTVIPLDSEIILKSISKTKCAVTEKNIIFRESGPPIELLKKYGLYTPFIVKAAEKVMARKKDNFYQ